MLIFFPPSPLDNLAAAVISCVTFDGNVALHRHTKCPAYRLVTWAEVTVNSESRISVIQ
jgi:uncharacterized OsmC-like protein